jgi:hypothetical protein
LKPFLFILVVFLSLTVAHGQTFKRQANETAEKFITRVTKFPNNYPSTIIETREWDTSKVIILAFIPTPDEITIGLMFVPIDSLTYKQILIDSFSTLGNTARVENVFFFNVDNDEAKELVVMTTYNQSQYGQSHKVYWNLLFDDPNFSALTKKLKDLPQISKKVDGPKFKKPNDVKVALLKLSRK